MRVNRPLVSQMAGNHLVTLNSKLPFTLPIGSLCQAPAVNGSGAWPRYGVSNKAREA